MGHSHAASFSLVPRFTLIGRPPFSFHLSEGLMVVGNNKHQLELVLLPVLPLKLVQFGLVLRLVIFADPAVLFALGTGEEILLVFHRTLSDVLFSECYLRMETP